MKIKTSIAAAVATVAIASQAQATVYDVTAYSTLLNVTLASTVGTYDDSTNIGSWNLFIDASAAHAFGTVINMGQANLTQTWTLDTVTGVVALAGGTNAVDGDGFSCVAITAADPCGTIGADFNGKNLTLSGALNIPGNTVFMLNAPAAGGLVPINVTFTAPTTSEVPVPAAAWLFGSALVGLAGVARRRAA